MMRPHSDMHFNKIYKKIKIALNITDNQVYGIFKLGGRETTNSELIGYRVGEGTKNYRPLYYDTLIQFLDGLIELRRDLILRQD